MRELPEEYREPPAHRSEKWFRNHDNAFFFVTMLAAAGFSLGLASFFILISR